MPHRRELAILAAIAGALAALAAVFPVRPLVAQERPTPGDTLSGTRCAGEIVSAIDVRTLPPPASDSELLWRVMTSTVAFAYGTTRPDVVTGLLLLREGEPCTELARAESERTLRAQPFLAAARVTALPDGAGRVRIAVETVDEFPAIARLRVSGVTPEAITLGTENIRGRAQSVALGVERGHAYRDGFGIRLTDDAVFDGPYAAAVEAERRPLGSLWSASLERPYYTELQRLAWRASVRSADDYQRLVRPDGDPLALQVRQLRWELGAIRRARLLGAGGFVGVALTGVRDKPAGAGVIVSDSGLVADEDDELLGRYEPFRVVRPVTFAGIRLLRYVPVRGFNTLRAVEDVPAGVQFGALVGRGIPAWGASDLHLAGTFYAAHVSPSTLLGIQVEVETRRDFDADDWNGLVASGRVAWYRQYGARRTLIVSDELAGGRRVPLPLQVTLGDRTGLRGHRGSRLAGSWRNVLRVEDRRVRSRPLFNTDLGIAAFVEAGTLWEGSAPYGDDVPFRGSAGIGLLAAYPSGSRRLARLDIVVPTHRDGNRAWSVRATLDRPTGRFWREPSDVTRARTGPVPSTLFTWLVR